MFASYSFEGQAVTKNVIPSALYAKRPDLCTGIVVFDIFIINCDRNKTNIKVDKQSSPSVVHVFDHERSLFYVYPKEGTKRLQQGQSRLGITDSHDSGGQDEWHCLIEHLDSIDILREWIHRVRTIPDWYIEDICNEVWKVSITKKERDAVIAFLKERRNEIGSLIQQHSDRFPQISNWPLIL